jgi:hypothetical protein
MIEKRDAEKAIRQADGAEPFERNAFYERLLVLRETKPEEFAHLSPASKIALGYYEGAKRRAASLTSGV